ncbi:MAG: malto-oligosyltrehalose trehalohydrolase [Deltaproteobacteria bacterium]
MKIGAHYLDGKCRFHVWAPFAQEMSLQIVSPREAVFPMEPAGRGYWKLALPDIASGTRYFFDVNGTRRPDPVSHYQPEGVQGPSEVVDHNSFRWNDQAWKGFDLRRAVIYELHVGTFTPEGTFQAVIPRLPALKQAGVTAVELMPVAQFPGARNWGYDGTYLFAVQNSYGGPQGLKELVNACHRHRLAVILDVCLNHLGPEGNFLSSFGPYFTNRCATPWGQSVNYDGTFADEVRNFATKNVLFWFYHYHIDALRLDAIQFIIDLSARHILQEISFKTRLFSAKNGKKLWLIAESDLNDVRVIRKHEQGGWGVDSQWLDDFHHSVHTLLTGETSGYYADYGKVSQLGKALEQGFVYSWDYSRFRKRHYGSSSLGMPPARFVAFNQNHDQVGNRLFGERLSTLVPFEALKLAAGVLLSSPYLPLLFMGEEYAEEAPFLYFVDHSDAQLLRAVSEGRKNEFKDFVWNSEPPEPHSAQTFERSRLRWEARDEGKGRAMLEYYRTLTGLRAGLRSLAVKSEPDTRVVLCDEDKKVLLFVRGDGKKSALCCANFSSEPREARVPGLGHGFKRAADSADARWLGPGIASSEVLHPEGDRLQLAPYNFVLYTDES